MKALYLTFSTLFFSTLVFAGGSGTVGPGAPKIRFACKDASDSIYVQIYQSPKDGYKKNYLGVTNTANGQSLGIYSGAARDVSNAAIGSGRLFKSSDYLLSIALGGAPRVDDQGVAHFAASLSNSTWLQPLNLNCKLL